MTTVTTVLLRRRGVDRAPPRADAKKSGTSLWRHCRDSTPAGPGGRVLNNQQKTKRPAAATGSWRSLGRAAKRHIQTAVWICLQAPKSHLLCAAFCHLTPFLLHENTNSIEYQFSPVSSQVESLAPTSNFALPFFGSSPRCCPKRFTNGPVGSFCIIPTRVISRREIQTDLQQPKQLLE